MSNISRKQEIVIILLSLLTENGELDWYYYKKQEEKKRKTVHDLASQLYKILDNFDGPGQDTFLKSNLLMSNITSYESMMQNIDSDIFETLKTELADCFGEATDIEDVNSEEYQSFDAVAETKTMEEVAEQMAEEMPEDLSDEISEPIAEPIIEAEDGLTAQDKDDEFEDSTYEDSTKELEPVNADSEEVDNDRTVTDLPEEDTLETSSFFDVETFDEPEPEEEPEPVQEPLAEPEEETEPEMSNEDANDMFSGFGTEAFDETPVEKEHEAEDTSADMFSGFGDLALEETDNIINLSDDQADTNADTNMFGDFSGFGDVNIVNLDSDGGSDNSVEDDSNGFGSFSGFGQEEKEVPVQEQKKNKGIWICPKCGAQNTSKFCMECGAKRADETEKKEESSLQTDEITSEESETNLFSSFGSMMEDTSAASTEPETKNKTDDSADFSGFASFLDSDSSNISKKTSTDTDDDESIDMESIVGRFIDLKG